MTFEREVVSAIDMLMLKHAGQGNCESLRSILVVDVSAKHRDKDELIGEGMRCDVLDGYAPLNATYGKPVRLGEARHDSGLPLQRGLHTLRTELVSMATDI